MNQALSKHTARIKKTLEEDAEYAELKGTAEEYISAISFTIVIGDG